MTVIDDFTHECPALETAFSFGSFDVVRCFESIAFERGLPQAVRFDNGPEFTSRAMLQWGAEPRSGTRVSSPTPGKRTTTRRDRIHRSAARRRWSTRTSSKWYRSRFLLMLNTTSGQNHKTYLRAQR